MRRCTALLEEVSMTFCCYSVIRHGKHVPGSTHVVIWPNGSLNTPSLPCVSAFMETYISPCHSMPQHAASLVCQNDLVLPFRLLYTQNMTLYI